MPDKGLPTEQDVVEWRLKMMTTERFANLMEVADIIGDMNADALEVLRKLGDAEHAGLRQFMREGKKETFEWLAGLRKDEVSDLNNAIENVRALQRSGKLLKKGSVALIAGFLLLAGFSEKITALWAWIRGIK